MIDPQKNQTKPRNPGLIARFPLILLKAHQRQKNPPLVVRMKVKPIVEECYSLIDTMQRKGESGDMGIGTLETITRGKAGSLGIG